jgi:AraC-like DNA-binding protein
MIRTINLLSPRTFPLVASRMAPQRDMDMHRHDNLELVLITQGTGSHRTAQGSYPLRRGDVFMVPIGMPHGYADTRGLTLINLAYDPTHLELPMDRLAALPGYQPLVALEPRLRGSQGFAGHLQVEEAHLVKLLALIDDLEDELADQPSGWRHAAAAQLLLILVRLARLYAIHDSPAARLVVRLGTVLTHIESHLATTLDLRQLSRIGGMSSSTLQRAFHAVFGTSVLQHVLELRLQAARQQLIGSDLPIAIIARRVGIDDANYFSRLFTAKVGMSPRAFRLGLARAERL